MIHHAASDSPAFPGRWDEVIRMIRMICLLREQGELTEAAHLEATALAAAITRVNLGGDEQVTPEVIDDLYAVERARVADAMVISELITRQLSRALPAGGPTGWNAASGGPTVTPPPRVTRSPDGPDAPPAIPDLLDSMLAQDRAARRRTA